MDTQRKIVLDAFINATRHTIETMCATKIHVGEIAHGNRYSPAPDWTSMTGLISLTSPQFHGNLILRFDTKAALEIVSKMLFEQHSKITHEVADAIGEITNIITGAAKREASTQNINFGMATPTVLVGEGVSINQSPGAEVMGAICSTEEGKIEVLLALNNAPK
jgi:chemotaxis protein CheX